VGHKRALKNNIEVEKDISVPDIEAYTEEEYIESSPFPFEHAYSKKCILNTNKILIVDDEKFNCDTIYGFMMILGVKNRAEIAEFAYNGEEALQ
jgi:hypothetical protein